jgi:hypothetical protein
LCTVKRSDGATADGLVEPHPGASGCSGGISGESHWSARVGFRAWPRAFAVGLGGWRRLTVPLVPDLENEHSAGAREFLQMQHSLELETELLQHLH